MGQGGRQVGGLSPENRDNMSLKSGGLQPPSPPLLKPLRVHGACLIKKEFLVLNYTNTQLTSLQKTHSRVSPDLRTINLM